MAPGWYPCSYQLALSWGAHRVVFDRAYAEIRYMLESNILSKFVTTEDFRKAANTTDLYTLRRRMFCLKWPGGGGELPSP